MTDSIQRDIDFERRTLARLIESDSEAQWAIYRLMNNHPHRASTERVIDDLTVDRARLARQIRNTRATLAWLTGELA